MRKEAVGGMKRKKKREESENEGLLNPIVDAS